MTQMTQIELSVSISLVLASGPCFDLCNPRNLRMVLGIEVWCAELKRQSSKPINFICRVFAAPHLFAISDLASFNSISTRWLARIDVVAPCLP